MLRGRFSILLWRALYILQCYTWVLNLHVLWVCSRSLTMRSSIPQLSVMSIPSHWGLYKAVFIANMSTETFSWTEFLVNIHVCTCTCRVSTCYKMQLSNLAIFTCWVSKLSPTLLTVCVYDGLFIMCCVSTESSPWRGPHTSHKHKSNYVIISTWSTQH